MRVLAIVPSVYDTSPGQRFRLEQWEPILRERGVEITYRPFENDALHTALYQQGATGAKVREVLRAFGRRWRGLRDAGDFDVAYVFREAALLGPAWFEKQIRRAGVPYIFDFDDAVFVSYKSPANGYLSYLKFPAKTATICRLAAHVTAGNPYLADYARQFNPNVAVIPTTIDTDKYTPEYRAEQPEVPVIGWSGSFSTVQHLDTIRGALQRLAREEKFILRVIGTPVYKLEGVETEAMQWRAATEIQDLRPFDIGVMPLPDDDWSKGKCGLKALQFMALGVPTICSPVGVNTDIIQDGANGMLATTEDDWVEKLRQLLHSPELRLKLGKAGRETVEQKYSAKAVAPKFYEALATVAQSRTAV
jgi:glycosyltransferase involved in cell wall biosynthesis